MEVNIGDIVLCQFYFTDLKRYKNRPVLVFIDNLPFKDFIGIPISSKIHTLYSDELLLNDTDFALGILPAKSKIMIRKTFVVSKESIIKKYAELTPQSLEKYRLHFCNYFQCI